MNPKLTIEVKSKLVNYKLEIEHKVTVITGHSGIGKSLFTSAVTDRTGIYKVYVSLPNYIFSVIDSVYWEDDYRAAINDSMDSSNKARIFIFDDVDFIKTDYFSKIFSEDKRNFYIFINRFDSLEEKSLSRVPFSIYAIYNFITDGRNHWLEPKYNFSVNPDACYDCVITEDSSSGFKFLQSYNKGVVSSKSKDNILKLLIKNQDILRTKKVLAFADLSSFGSCIRKLIEFSTRNGIELSFVPDYQCFEYLLLTSNLIGKLKSKEQILAYSGSTNNVVKFSSLEKLYESLLNHITKGTVLHQGHGGELNSCYCIDCKNCKKDKKRVPCKYGLKGNKQEALIQGTQWEEVLTVISNSELVPLNQK